MIKILFEIERIDYDSCIENLLPGFVSDCACAENPSELDRFLARLGSDAVPAAKKIMKYLDPGARDEVLIALADLRRDQLVQAANEHLEKLLAGKSVVIGGFALEDLPGSWLRLGATQVTITYEELVNSPLLSKGILGGAAKLAVQMASPATIEKTAIKVLSSDRVKPKVLSALSEALQSVGLIVSLRDMTVLEDTDTDHSESPKKEEGLFPTAVLDLLIDAVVSWMRESL